MALEEEYKPELKKKFLDDWLPPDKLREYTLAFESATNDLQREIISTLANLEASISLIKTEYDPSNPIAIQMILYHKLDKAFRNLYIIPDDYISNYPSS